MGNRKIRIGIVDDHPVVIQGLKTLFDQNDNFDVVAAFTEGKKIIDYVKLERLDIVLLDIALPDGNGVDICREIKKVSSDTGVIFISNRTDRTIILQSIKNGANGYLLKNSSMEELMDSINNVVNGRFVLSREVEKIISKPSPSELQEIPRLTNREIEVLQLMAEGKTSPEIAKVLFLSSLTVVTHRRNILQKFNAKNSFDVIRMAKDYGIIY